MEQREHTSPRYFPCETVNERRFKNCLGDESGINKTKQIEKQSDYSHQSNYSVKNILHNQ